MYNLEYEYWSKKASGPNGYYCVNYLEENSLPCTRNDSFNFFINNLKELKILSKNNVHNIKIEATVGHYSQKEIASIVKNCDRLLIQTFGKNPKSSFDSAKKSLAHFLTINNKIEASILFSTRMNHMGYWFKTNSLQSSETMFIDKVNSNNSSLKSKLNLGDFSYHTYSFLEKSISYYSYIKN